VRWTSAALCMVGLSCPTCGVKVSGVAHTPCKVVKWDSKSHYNVIPSTVILSAVPTTPTKGPSPRAPEFGSVACRGTSKPTNAPRVVGHAMSKRAGRGSKSLGCQTGRHCSNTTQGPKGHRVAQPGHGRVGPPSRQDGWRACHPTWRVQL